jgi:hypothetical protein
MRLQRRFAFQGFEQKLQETRNERQAETKRVERLSAILAKKIDSARTKGLIIRVA